MDAQWRRLRGDIGKCNKRHQQNRLTEVSLFFNTIRVSG